MDSILVAVFSVTSIGVTCAAVLCIASKIMFVKIDERIDQVRDYLPGVNCGVCGYPGCSGYASALIADNKIKTNLCTPGGAAVSVKISGLLGVEAGTVERKSAFVHCAGDCSVQQKKMEYKGVQSCEAAKQLYGGEAACAFGCLGYGDCYKICPSNAICMVNGLARINTDLCTGCGLCVKTCPNKLISVEKAAIIVVVLCKNIEKGATVRKKCSKGCIACGKCVRCCESGAITMEDNIAKIDYEKCTLCGACAYECVTGTILRTANAAKE